MNPHQSLDLELAMIRDHVQRLTMFVPYMTQESAAKMRAIAYELGELIEASRSVAA